MPDFWHAGGNCAILVFFLGKIMEEGLLPAGLALPGDTGVIALNGLLAALCKKGRPPSTGG
jgi:hypothetical protein